MAGGTALALQFGHRTSADLDFFSDETFAEDFLLGVYKKNKWGAAWKKRELGASGRCERRDYVTERPRMGLRAVPLHLLRGRSWSVKAHDTHNSVTAVSKTIPVGTIPVGRKQAAPAAEPATEDPDIPESFE